jgi:hypothetical protein
MKYLQAEYEVTVVAGVSQGGIAAFLNALQSRPDAAVIASGFSVLSERVRCSDLDQLLVPGVWTRLTPDVIRREILESPTRFFFTYGRSESGTYRMEAEEGVTARFLGDLRNVSFATHDGGHVYPVPIVHEFLAGIIDSGKIGRTTRPGCRIR